MYKTSPHKPSNYFEGVLQLRNPTQEVVDYVTGSIDGSGKVRIAKTAKHANGIDIFLSSNTFLRQIGKKLKERFPGELKLTSSLHTRNYLTQKDVYRGCVMFRYYSVKRGDIITIKGEEIEVMSVSREILGKSRESGKKVHIGFDKLRDAKITSS